MEVAIAIEDVKDLVSNIWLPVVSSIGADSDNPDINLDLNQPTILCIQSNPKIFPGRWRCPGPMDSPPYLPPTSYLFPRLRKSGTVGLGHRFIRIGGDVVQLSVFG